MADLNQPVPNFAYREPKSEADLAYWLTNMVGHHRYSVEEVQAGTGLPADTVRQALGRLGLDIPRQDSRLREGDVLQLAPWPGGRALSDWGPPVEPTRQRETKATVFAPWDDRDYVVLDVPEAVFSNLGILYLAHVHVPTLWTDSGVQLERLEWDRQADGSLAMRRVLPNGVAYEAHLRPTPDSVLMRLALTNGTKRTLTELRVQNCVFLKGMSGMQNEDKPKVHVDGAYTAYGTHDGSRWVVTVWQPHNNCWHNPKNPCFHSDPRFPDCDPNETSIVSGWLSFFEGSDIAGEIERIRQIDWQSGSNENPKKPQTPGKAIS